MKIAVLGDTHFGLRNDSQIFHEYLDKFYTKVFFPYLVEHNITTVIQTGDLFDRRKFINFNTLELCKGYFFDKFEEHSIYLYTYLGNHDCYYKNTLAVNSPELTLGEYHHFIEIIKEPETHQFGTMEKSVAIDIIPWICSDNEKQIKEFIQNSKSQICFGHFEITGFSMEKGSVCYDGMSRSDLSKYDMVLSGHFHHRSTDGHIFYVGSPYEMTWADHDDRRGFHVFDTETRSLDFIPNPYIMFHKIEYDDANETIESIDAKDYREYQNTYVKVIVKNKTSHMLFDRFISNFYQAGPADLGIVEDYTDYTTLADLMDGSVDQGDNTHVLLDKYVDSIELGLDKDKMKTVMRSIYHEAQALENT